MSMEIIAEANMDLSFKVLGIKDSLYSMEICFVTMKMTLSSQFLNMEINSENANENDQISTIVKSFVNKPFLAKISKTGRVYSIAADSLIDSIAKNLSNAQNPNNDMAIKQIKDNFGGNSLKASLENGLAIYTGKIQNVGSKWKRVLTVSNGIALKLENSYEVVSIQNNEYTIKSTGTVSSLDSNPIEQNGMMMTYEMNGTGEGNLRIDMKTGWIVNGTFSQSLKGEANILPNTQIPNGMSIPITISNNGVITK